MSQRFLCAVLGIFFFSPIASAYIHFPPMKLPKLCKDSSHIRVLTVKKFSKEKGVIIFEAETLKASDANIKSFKQVLDADTKDVKPLLDWVGEGKKAVMFTIEGNPRGQMGCGFVFIDQYCYSVDYGRTAETWMVMR